MAWGWLWGKEEDKPSKTYTEQRDEEDMLVDFTQGSTTQTDQHQNEDQSEMSQRGDSQADKQAYGEDHAHEIGVTNNDDDQTQNLSFSNTQKSFRAVENESIQELKELESDENIHKFGLWVAEGLGITDEEKKKEVGDSFVKLFKSRRDNRVSSDGGDSPKTNNMNISGRPYDPRFDKYVNFDPIENEEQFLKDMDLMNPTEIQNRINILTRNPYHQISDENKLLRERKLSLLTQVYEGKMAQQNQNRVSPYEALQIRQQEKETVENMGTGEISFGRKEKNLILAGHYDIVNNEVYRKKHLRMKEEYND